MLFKKSLETILQILENDVGAAPPIFKAKILHLIKISPDIPFKPTYASTILMDFARGANIRLDMPQAFDIQEFLHVLAACIITIAEQFRKGTKFPVSPPEASAVVFIAYMTAYLGRSVEDLALGASGAVVVIPLSPLIMQKIRDMLADKEKKVDLKEFIRYHWDPSKGIS